MGTNLEIMDSTATVPPPVNLAAATLATPALPIMPADNHPIITPLLLRDLHAYARERLAGGDGGEGLRVVEADLPDLVTTLGIGFLPLTYREALPSAVRAALAGLRIAGTLLVPAFDEQGAVVDLLAIRPQRSGGAYRGIWPEPRGLIAPPVVTSFPSLIVVDSLRVMARLYRSGHRNVALVRGPSDVAVNTARFVAGGVTRVEVRVLRSADLIAAFFSTAGITTRIESWRSGVDDDSVALPSDTEPLVPATAPASTADEPQPLPAPIAFPFPVIPEPSVEDVVIASAPPPPPTSVTVEVPPLDLIGHDRQAERATFTAGPSTYVVDVPWDREAKQEVTLRHAGKVFLDTFHLGSAGDRQRAAANAALRCGVPAAVIEAHLTELREQTLALIEADDAAPAATLMTTGAEYDEALALLRRPDLFDVLAADLETLGWVGEAEQKRLLLLTSTSRKLPAPLWSALVGSTAATPALRLVAELTPPEDVVHLSRVSVAALYYEDEHALRHRLLVIDEADELAPEVATTLAVLHERGAISSAHVPRHNLSGSARTRTVEVRGPVALLTATSGGLSERLLGRCCLVPVDESPEQTARVLAAQRRLHAEPGLHATGAKRTAIVRRHHALQRLLQARPVVVPFIERLVFPSVTVQHRLDQERFLGLIAASALVHQHQRLSDRGHVVADERDFKVALALASTAGIGADPGLGRTAAQLLAALVEAKVPTFSMEQCQQYLPHLSRTSLRNAVADLITLDYVASPRSGRGKQREYVLLPGAAAVVAGGPSISLHPVGWLAQVGTSESANFTPVTSSG